MVLTEDGWRELEGRLRPDLGSLSESVNPGLLTERISQLWPLGLGTEWIRVEQQETEWISQLSSAHSHSETGGRPAARGT
jgi:hypothetical protein